MQFGTNMQQIGGITGANAVEIICAIVTSLCASLIDAEDLATDLRYKGLLAGIVKHLMAAINNDLDYEVAQIRVQ